MKTKRKRLLVVITAVLTLLAIVVFSQLYFPSVPLQILHGKKPLINEQSNTSTRLAFCFPSAFEDVISKAATELTSLGYSDVSPPSLPSTYRLFKKMESNCQTIITISAQRLSKQSTSSRSIWKSGEGYVTVETRWHGISKLRLRMLKLRHFLNRTFQPTPNPTSSRRFSNLPLPIA